MYDPTKPNERLDVIVCGRMLGTSDGWDMVTDECLLFPDFLPTEPNLFKMKMDQRVTLQVDLQNGWLEIFDDGQTIDEGNQPKPILKTDLVEFLSKFVRHNDDKRLAV